MQHATRGCPYDREGEKGRGQQQAGAPSISGCREISPSIIAHEILTLQKAQLLCEDINPLKGRFGVIESIPHVYHRLSNIINIYQDILLNDLNHKAILDAKSKGANARSPPPSVEAISQI